MARARAQYVKTNPSASRINESSGSVAPRRSSTARARSPTRNATNPPSATTAVRTTAPRRVKSGRSSVRYHQRTCRSAPVQSRSEGLQRSHHAIRRDARASAGSGSARASETSTGRGSRNPSRRRNVTRSVTAPASRSPVPSRWSTIESRRPSTCRPSAARARASHTSSWKWISRRGSRPSRSRCPNEAGRSGPRYRPRASGRKPARSSAPARDAPDVDAPSSATGADERPSGRRAASDRASARSTIPGVGDETALDRCPSLTSPSRPTIVPAPRSRRGGAKHHTTRLSPRHRRSARGRSRLRGRWYTREPLS